MRAAARGAHLAAFGGVRAIGGGRSAAREELGSASRFGLSRRLDHRDRGRLPACLAIAKAGTNPRTAYSNEYRRNDTGRDVAGLADSGTRHSSLPIPRRSVGARAKPARYPHLGAMASHGA